MRSIESNYMTLLALEKRNQKWHKKQFLGKWDKMWSDYAKVGGKVNHFYFTKKIYPCLQVIWIIKLALAVTYTKEVLVRQYFSFSYWKDS